MTFIAILFLAALALSAIAAFYSILGLLTLFPAAGTSIIIMGVTMEVAKLVSASWLYRNWLSSPKALKYYFTIAVVVLSFITSMGIFGYLSKSHIDQKFSFSDSSVIVKNLEREIQSEELAIKNAQNNLDILDRLVTNADPKDANFIRNRQKRERETIASQIRSASDKIKTLNSELTPLRQQSARIEAEIGPIKYVADLLYGESNERIIEKAVRWVIITIVFVFDPLAIILLIAANRELKMHSKRVVAKVYRGKKNKNNVSDFSYPSDGSKVYVDKSQIAEIPKEILEKVFSKKSKK